MTDREVMMKVLNDGWVTVNRAISKLFSILEGSSNRLTPDEYINCYTVIYNLCSGNVFYCQQLYDCYRMVIENYLEKEVMPDLRMRHDEFMLKEFVRRWDNHNTMVKCLCRLFEYLDRHFVQREFKPTLNQVGMICFKDIVFQKLKENVRNTVIFLIDKEREGEQIDRILLRKVLGIFVNMEWDSMGTYEADFETPMLDSTTAYYSRRAASWIVEYSCPEYMVKAEDCLKREKERVDNYLHASSETKLLEKVQQEILLHYKQQILENEHSGCHVLLRNNKVDDLSRMYKLFCEIPKGLDPIALSFRVHVTEEGTALVKQAVDAASKKKPDTVGSQDEAFVGKVLNLHNKYLQYISECFNNHLLFNKALKGAFETFCNKDIAGNTSAQLIAAYCDNLLKNRESEKLSEEAIEDTLEKVVKMLAYISDRDLFAEFYKQKLARRLLNDKSGNNDQERSMLSKLKQEFGGLFTSKMEGMVKDATLARENYTQFEEHLRENPECNPGADLTVQVLTSGFWPTYKPSDLILPAELVKCVESFKEFYHKRNKNRKLTWICQLGTCHVTGDFGGKRYEFVVTTHQAAVLLLFNDSERLSYTDIKNQVNLTDDEIVRQLHSLSCAKYKILRKEPDNKTIDSNDIFEFNAKFTDRQRRIRVPMPPMDEKKKVVEDVCKDRKYAIDACLVRIMKSRKVLVYQQLVLECVEQLSRMFKPDIKMIKSRIEDLIAREYLERDRKTPNTFKYLA